MEERFVFPIGRRTWQILSLLALVALFLSVAYFLFNSTPTGRNSVSVSKNEVVENKIDTTSASASPTPVETCKVEEYRAFEDSLKKDLPNSEWNKLGDSSDPYEAYVLDETGNYVTVQKRDYIKNEMAIPNILWEIFNRKGLDSSDDCKRIEIVKTLHALNKWHNQSYLTEKGFYYNAEVVAKNEVNLTTVEQANNLYSTIENKNPNISDDKSFSATFRYLFYVIQNKPSSEKLGLVKSILTEHRQLKEAKYSKDDYFDLAEVIFESDLSDTDLKSAIEGFNEDLAFYDQNNLKSSLKRYLKIYEEKLERAASEQARRMAEKEARRGMSLMSAGGAFLSIVLIATILLLFSIQSLLKKHVVKQD